MRQKLLTNIGRWAGEKTWLMLVIIIVVTFGLGYLSEQLEMSMDLTSLLPKDDPMVDEFNYIFEEFNGASTIFIAVEGDKDDMIAFADHITPTIKNIEAWLTTEASDKVKKQYQAAMNKVADGKIKYRGKYIQRVEYRQPVDFMRNHGLMLVKPKDLENTSDIYTDPNLLPFLTNLNNSLEKEYIQSDEKISTSQREQAATAFMEGIESWVDYTEAALYDSEYDPALADEAAQAAGLGTPYLISADRTMLLIMVEPTFNIMEIDHVLPCINGLEEYVKQVAPEFKVQAGLTGSVVLGRDETVAGLEDSMLLTILAMVLVLILFVVTFRMLSAPLLAVLNLIIGITWAMGISWLLVQTLNMFTAMMAVVLVGLGIDFSIHIISVFSELVNKGIAPKQAIIETLQKVGTGIITGGITTAAAFLTLIIGHSTGMSEFGLVCGVGLIVIMVATLISLPTMLMIRERYRTWRKKEIIKTRDVAYGAVGTLGETVSRRWKFSLVSILLVTMLFGLMISRVTFDYNYLNMEPVGLESIELNNKIIDKFNFSSDVTMMTAISLEENFRYTEEAKAKSSVSYVESLTDYLPSSEEQDWRRPALLRLTKAMKSSQITGQITERDRAAIQDELYRLESNIIELQDLAYIGGQDMVDQKASRMVGNPDQPAVQGSLSEFIERFRSEPVDADRLAGFNVDFAKSYRRLVLDMADTTTINQDMLPDIVKDKFISKSGDRFLLTIYPKGDVWSIDYLEVFTKDVLDISPSISGTPPMFYYLLKIIGADGRRASLLTLLVVLAFLWLDFRSLKLALLAMLPLLFGVIWMVGIMGAAGIQLTLLNIMAIPLIIGIGIDDGVHIIHRYLVEGKGKMYTVFSSTGKAIIITSLTTMLAFGSLVFATYRGFGSFGLALFLGVATCLLASLLVLPTILGAIAKTDSR